MENYSVAFKEIYELFQKVLENISTTNNEFLTTALIDHILAIIVQNY